MAKFNFRLQQFLDVKEQIEEQKEMEYGRAIRQLEEEKTRLRRMQEQLKAQVEAQRIQVMNVLDPIEIKFLNTSIERLKAHILFQEERVQAAAHYVEVKRQELVEAMKERKALEIVRDKAQEAFRIEENLAEQKQVDELVSFKYKILQDAKGAVQA